LSASATDSDGSISRVEFYNGPTLLGADTASPYTYTWSGVAAGSYSLTARAFDNQGAATTSAPINVTVTASGTSNPSPASTPTYVQGNYAVPQTPQTTVVLPYTAAQTAGNLNVVIVGWNDTIAQVSSVTDKAGNVYYLAKGTTTMPTGVLTLSGALTQSIYYAKNIKAAAAGANAVTVTFTQAARFPDIRILEYSGIDKTNPMDVAVGAVGNSSTSSSGTVTTSYAKDLVLGANTVQTSTSGPGTNFTRRLLTSPDGDIAQDRVVTATGSYSTSAPISGSGGWVMQMVAFRAASTPNQAPVVSLVAPPVERTSLHRPPSR
jgi:hypothetical protein